MPEISDVSVTHAPVYPASLAKVMTGLIEAKTVEVALRHGCDRAMLSDCWAESQGGECWCKREACEELRAKEK